MQHIEELNNTVPSETLLFMKPSTALRSLNEPVVIPKNLGPCHNELEVSVLIKHRLVNASLQQVKAGIWGFGLGLDLTLRDVQAELKKQGHPWERAKAFDNSCPMSQFIAQDEVYDLANLDFSLLVNDKPRQVGNTKQMLMPIVNLIIEISNNFTLLPGDIVMTGTPKGVGPLAVNEQLIIELNGYFSVSTCVA
jgi:2-keto-4-pentenoate hydratase/2-oxohepta-3-ene-1,7-dioic acid hydratase in catechol pathway